MKVYLDTNVIMEFFVHRAQFSAVKDILETAQQGEIEACMSPMSLSTVIYLLGLHLKLNGIHEPEKREQIRGLLEELMNYVSVVDISNEYCKLAISDSQFKDMEDALQYYCARENGCSNLVTINLKHFPSSNDTLEVSSPSDFVDKYMD